jgi:hypothetical protein
MSRARSLAPPLAVAALLLCSAPAPAAPVKATSARAVAPAQARAVAENAITFSEYAVGTTITNQYASRGVVFSSAVFISPDGSNPTAPVLSGTPRFTGEITAEFVTPGTTTRTTTNGFALDVGYIDSRNSVVVDYFDANGVIVASQYAQSYGINHLSVTYRGVAGFTVRTVSSEPNGFAIDNLVIDPTVRTPVSSIASLGDSYSSGEGRTDNKYDCGTDLRYGNYWADSTVPQFEPYWIQGQDCDTRTLSFMRPADLFQRPIRLYDNRCHRHGGAYPNRIRESLGASPSLFVACSGAITDNIGATDGSSNVEPTAQKPNSPVNVAGGNTQLTDLLNFRRDRLGGEDPSVITVGIGGNDAQFGPLIGHCLRPWVSDCKAGTDWADSALSTINGDTFDRLVDTFTTLRETFPGSTLLVFGYVSVLDPGDTCNPSTGGMDANETRFLAGDVLDAINQAVSDAAAQAGAFYVDIKGVTAGHGVCDEDPWVNGIIAYDTQQSFHPNPRAHEAVASYFIDHYTDGQGNLLVANPPPSGTIRPNVGHSLRLATLNGTVLQNCGAGCVQPSAGCFQGCPVHVEGQGYAPNAQLQVTLHSDPVSLGTVVADAQGRIDTTVTIPADTPPGQHYLAVDGTAPDGSPQEGTLPIMVSDVPLAPLRVPPAAEPAATPTPAPTVKPRKAPNVRVRSKRSRSTLRLRLTCPKTAPSSCAVTVKLQRKRGKAFRTLVTKRVTVRANRTRTIVLRRGDIRRVRKQLRLVVATKTSLGTASRNLKVPR